MAINHENERRRAFEKVTRVTWRGTEDVYTAEKHLLVQAAQRRLMPDDLGDYESAVTIIWGGQAHEVGAADIGGLLTLLDGAVLAREALRARVSLGDGGETAAPVRATLGGVPIRSADKAMGDRNAGYSDR